MARFLYLPPHTSRYHHQVQKEMEVEEAEEEKNTEAWNEVDFVTAQYGEVRTKKMQRPLKRFCEFDETKILLNEI